PKSLVPCTPLGALPSAISLVWEEMFQTIQCVNRPLGASGSSTTRARLFALEGISEICKGGLLSPPSHVNFDGMFPPSRKAELVIFILAPPAANEASATRATASAPALI